MSASPEYGYGEYEDDNEWDGWHHFDVIEREERAQHEWLPWLGRLLAIGIGIPIILAVIVFLLILAF